MMIPASAQAGMTIWSDKDLSLDGRVNVQAYRKARAGIARVDGLIEREKPKIKRVLTTLVDKSKSN